MALSVVVELELLLDAELLPLEDGDENRLVDARSAADMLLEPDEPDEPDDDEPLEATPAVELTVELGVELLLDPPPLRPKLERLPLSRGLMREAKFSAAVTPVSRMV